MRYFAPIAVLFLAAIGAVAGETASVRRISPAIKLVKPIRVTVNPRVELMSIAQEIGGYRDRYPTLLTRDSSAYRQEVEQLTKILSETRKLNPAG